MKTYNTIAILMYAKKVTVEAEDKAQAIEKAAQIIEAQDTDDMKLTENPREFISVDHR